MASFPFWVFAMSLIVMLLVGWFLPRAWRQLQEAQSATEVALRRSQAALAEAQRVAHVGSFEWEIEHDQLRWSAELFRIYGVERETFGANLAAFLSLVHPDDRERVQTHVSQAVRACEPFELEERIVRPDGEVRTLATHGRVVVDEAGKPVSVVGVCQDITARKDAEVALAHQALHDALTGLPNRTLFLDRLGQALAHRNRRRVGVAVLFLDLDRFKWVNDSLGHHAGDQLLLSVAASLAGATREGDTVARFGGDEFVVVCDDVKDQHDATQLAQRLSDAIAQPLKVEGQEITPGVSIGIAFAGPDDDVTADSMVRDADAAMYRAKEQGRGRTEVFDAVMRAVAQERLETETALRHGIDRGHLAIYYQPVVELMTGGLAGLEALVRWEHPTRGLLLPPEFVPLAEETGLIWQLGAAVLDEACGQMADWNKRKPGSVPLTISVNLSARQLLTPGIASLVETTLAVAGLPPQLLCLEITESVFLGDADTAGRALAELKALGVQIAVDDFGTGYSSLSYLQRFPLDILKIDRSFVEGAVRRRQDRAIVAGLVDLAHAFGIATIGEGVETPEQLEVLKTLGCEQGQGYYWSSPLTAPEASAWIEHVERARTTERVGAAGRRARVLVVDDDASLRRLLELVLTESDQFELVATAADGREAIALARQHQPDLVLLDLAMPGMGGLEALPLIRAVVPSSRIVVLSGLDSEDMAQRALECGATSYITKGFDPIRLTDLLEPLLILN